MHRSNPILIVVAGIRSAHRQSPPQTLRSRTIVIGRVDQAGDGWAKFSTETTLVDTALGACINRSWKQDTWVVLAHDQNFGGRHFCAKKTGDLQSTEAGHADV